MVSRGHNEGEVENGGSREQEVLSTCTIQTRLINPNKQVKGYNQLQTNTIVIHKSKIK